MLSIKLIVTLQVLNLDFKTTVLLSPHSQQPLQSCLLLLSSNGCQQNNFPCVVIQLVFHMNFASWTEKTYIFYICIFFPPGEVLNQHCKAFPRRRLWDSAGRHRRWATSLFIFEVSSHRYISHFGTYLIFSSLSILLLTLEDCIYCLFGSRNATSLNNGRIILNENSQEENLALEKYAFSNAMALSGEIIHTV